MTVEHLEKSAAHKTSCNHEGLLRQDGSGRRKFLQFLIDKGLAQKDDDGKIAIIADWKDKDNRVAAIIGLLETLEIKPTDLTAQIFFDNGLISLFMYNSHRGNNEKGVLKTINEAYPECNFHVWDLKHASKSALDNDTTANQAIEWFVTKWCSTNDITELTIGDFVKNGIEFAIKYYYSNIYVAVLNGYTGMGFDDWKRFTALHVDRKSIEDRLNRECVLKGVSRFSESVYSIKYETFEAYGIEYVLDYYRSKRNVGSSDKSIIIDKNLLVYDAIMEMHPLNFEVWRMSNPPHSLFAIKENRIGATKFVSRKSGKNISNLLMKDYESLGFKWLIDEFYGGDTYSAGIEALSGFLQP